MRFALAIGLSLLVPHLVRAEDFRVDSQVFVGKETTPQSSNMTLFQGTHAFDFLDQPRQIAFYDLPRGRVVLVDPARRVKAEVTRATLDAFCDNLQHLAKRTEDPILDFALRPSFEESDDEDSDERLFSSKYVTYRVKPLAGELEGMASQYRAFSDTSARLNALVNRGSLPPFPRLLVNQSLQKSGQVPAQVILTISPARLVGGRTVALRSQHEFRPRLLDSDLRKIDEAGEGLASAKLVGLGEYLKPSLAE
ncbi:MAG: hypothetical protein WD894_15000 [Pirellulales bacterium]